MRFTFRLRAGTRTKQSGLMMRYLCQGKGEYVHVVLVGGENGTQMLCKNAAAQILWQEQDATLQKTLQRKTTNGGHDSNVG